MFFFIYVFNDVIIYVLLYLRTTVSRNPSRRAVTDDVTQPSIYKTRPKIAIIIIIIIIII